MAAGLTAAGSILSGIGAVGGLFGGSSGHASARQYMYNLALQKQAQKWNEKVYKNRYQWQRQDLEAAGINPLYGLGSAPTMTSGQGSVGMEDDQGAANGRMQNAINLIGMATDWSAKKAQIENTKQQTKTEAQNTLLKGYEAIGKQLDNLYKKKELTWQDKKNEMELKRQQSEILRNFQDIEESKSRIPLNRANTAKAYAETNKTNTETNILTPEATQSKEYGSFLKKHPGFAGTMKGVKDALTVLGVAGGTAVGMTAAGKGIKTAKKVKAVKKVNYK